MASPREQQPRIPVRFKPLPDLRHLPNVRAIAAPGSPFARLLAPMDIRPIAPAR